MPDGLVDFGSTITTQGMVVAQISKWLPTWLTPIWVFAAGLIVGAIACVVVFGVLAMLSYVPGIGKLADDPVRGTVASLIVGGIIA